MQEKLEQRSFLLLLLLITGLFGYLLKPFFGALFWSCVIAIMFYPLHHYLTERWSGRRNLAALTTLLICAIMVIVPTLFVAASFFQEGAKIYQKLQDGDLDPGTYVEQLKTAFPAVQDFLGRFGIDLEKFKSLLADSAVSSSRWIAENAVQLGQGTMTLFLNIGLLLYVTFFFLRDGPKLVMLLVRALPMGDEREHQLFDKFSEVTRATVKGNLVVAIAQGTLGGLIFWILDIPGPILWGVVMTVLSLIPVVGAGLIWAPVAIYLFAIGEWVDAAILTAFGAVVIGLVDNILRPILVGRDTKLPDYVVLLSTLGGFSLFGINGFVIGPLIAALFLTFWEIFIREFNPGFDPSDLRGEPELEEWQDKQEQASEASDSTK
ncbi:AI-2E family transporter [Lacimicrobium alkaliphilum]|uniref:AI-2E family transporter n=1 Tax=Lacimicrobium alkaliphilum TaxID=1526571 RepID=A0ABQ1R4R0_9ALTE|nr:AI-2E family transporter [Lacimicrobium alkaliphilum]GGD58103.1 AI-2E family transporter [Lacimicrobium alkaliphilum]